MELNMKEPKDINELRAELEKIPDMPKNFDVIVENNILSIDGKWLLKRSKTPEHLLETIQCNLEQNESQNPSEGYIPTFRSEVRKTIEDMEESIDVDTKKLLCIHVEDMEEEKPQIILSYISILETIRKEDIYKWKKDGFECYDLNEIDRKQLSPSASYTYGILMREKDFIHSTLDKYGKVNKKYFRKYFFYGIDNRQPILEGIIYDSCRDLNEKYLKLETGEKFPSKEEKIEELRRHTFIKYKQLYKFLNVIEEDDKRFNSNLTSEEEDRVKSIVDTAIDEMQNNGMLLVFKRGIFVKDRPDEKNPIVYNKDEHIWTDEMCDVLKQLEYLEELDKQDYYKAWLEAKFSRLECKGYKPSELDELKQPFKRYLQEKEAKKEKQQV